MSVEQSQLPRTLLWRRMDVEGMDACRFNTSVQGYLISGTALYLHGEKAARFEYSVSCNSDWSSQSAWVRGWLGRKELGFSISHDLTGNWTVDGIAIDGLRGLRDVNLGFTPATNTNAIKRMGLAVGEETETTAVWLDVDEWHFKPLRQVYRRLSETDYDYRSPTHDYSAILSTDAFGVVRQYPELWKAVSGSNAHQS